MSKRQFGTYGLLFSVFALASSFLRPVLLLCGLLQPPIHAEHIESSGPSPPSLQVSVGNVTVKWTDNAEEESKFQEHSRVRADNLLERGIQLCAVLLALMALILTGTSSTAERDYWVIGVTVTLTRISHKKLKAPRRLGRKTS